MKQNKHSAPSKPRRQKGLKKRTAAEKKPVVGKAVLEALIHFREYHPAYRFSRNLRTMLIDFLMYEDTMETEYLQDLLYDLQGLFDFLEAIQLDHEIDEDPDR